MSLNKEDLADLPEDVRDMISPHLDPTIETLDAIGVAIARKRDEAVTARSSSGIETIWEECEEAYVGIDDANRGEFGGGRWTKSMSLNGPVTTGTVKPANTKSSIFLRLTARYVDAGKAKLAEILLPPNDKAFSMSGSPSPDLIRAKDDHSHVLGGPDGKTPLMRPAKEGEVPDTSPAPGSHTMAPAPSPSGPQAAGTSPPAPAAPAAAGVGTAVPAPAAGAPPPPMVPLKVSDLAKENIELANKKAEAAETRIYDWMVSSKYNREMRKVVFDSARCGPGVIKGPVPKIKRGIAVSKSKSGGVDIQIREDTKPSVCWVDFWNLFPDPSCGENIHDGDYVFERDFLSQRGVRQLKKLKGYVESQIDKVIAEGPVATKPSNTSAAPTKLDGESTKKGRFEVWYYYGVLSREEMNCVHFAATGNKLTAADVPEDKKQVYAIVTMINSTIVRATINPLDSGNFPYQVMNWQRRTGHWAGIGIAEQLRAPQRMLNAAVRALLNNAGKSAGSQIVVDQGCIRPANGSWDLSPDKIWYKTQDSPGQSVGDAFEIHEIPNVTDEMLKIIDLAMKQAEEATSIPLVTQGQTDTTTPETLGGMQLQDTNANQLLRDIGWSFDDSITEPLVNDFYEWLLLDPDVPDEEKGDFEINAHGSIALIERSIQDQVLVQLPALSLNPAYNLDPEKCIEMFLKSKHLKPSDVQYSEEQKEANSKQPPPKPPQVQVAEINASVARDKIVSSQSADQQNKQHEAQLHEASLALEGKDAENDAARIQAEERRTHAEQVVRLHEIQMKHDTALMDYANKRGISLIAAKKDLAKTAMTLQAQRELNAADNAVDLHKHHNPAPEPGVRKTQPKHIIPTSPARPLAQTPGRAANGKAFEQ